MFKRYAAFLFFLLLNLITFQFAFAQVTKIDPLISTFAREKSTPIEEGISASKAITANEEGRLFVDCFVQVFNPVFAQKIADKIQSLGGVVRTLVEDIMTAKVPLDAIQTIASDEDVRYIEAGKPLLSKLSSSIVVTHVNDVQAGVDLDKRYDGAGTIIGIVDDTRLDWKHDDFKDADNKTRILFVWDKGNSGSGVTAISNSNGLECSNTQIDKGTCTATSGGSTNSHATHVAGIAASDNATFKGMAPGANIINVFNVESDANSGANLSTTIVDDVRYVFAKASALGRPAVVNLSLGTSIGAHDNTSSMETALNNLVKGNPGRAITNAAGNEHMNPFDDNGLYGGLHGDIAVSGGVNKAFDFAVRSGSSLASLGREVIVDVWLHAASTCTVELDAFDFAKTAVSINMAAVSAGNTGTATNGSGTTLTVDFTDSTNANNGKRHAIGKVQFSTAVSNATMQNFSFDLILRGTCIGDLWLWPDRNSTNSITRRFGGTNQGFGYTYVNGDSARTITIPATASEIIAVASFMSRATWTDSTGTLHAQTDNSGSDFTSLGATGGTVSAISLFSSHGPTADERIKPDIAAPGEPIVSSMSTNSTVASGRRVDSKHFKNEGTSMSAPHVAGIIALMFQKNKCLTSAQVKKLITDNAVSDGSTGFSLPNEIWGYGKVDALATMKDITSYSGDCGVTSASGKQETPAFESAKGGGCMHLSGAQPIHFAIFIPGIFLLITLRFKKSFKA